MSLIGRGRRWGGRLFEGGRLLTFSALRMGANSRLGAYSNKYGNRFLIVSISSVDVLLYALKISTGFCKHRIRPHSVTIRIAGSDLPSV